MSTTWFRVRSLVAITVMVTLGVVGMALGGSMGVAAGVSAQNCWSALTAPANPGQQIELKDVSGLPNGEAWAVGSQHSGGVNFDGLVLRFDGASWRQVPSPSAGGMLEAVEAIAPDNVWAVGSSAGNQRPSTLIIHWDGTSWKVVPSPNPGADGNSLTAISALSPTDIWAAGATVPARSTAQPLMLHWDGQAWTERPAPNLAGPSSAQSIAAIAQDDVWVTGVNDGSHLLAMHWDGSEWAVNTNLEKRLNLVGYDAGELRDVSAIGRNDVWGVGYYREFVSGKLQVFTLVVHWDGASWTRVPSPSQGRGTPTATSGILNGVSSVARDNVWAVGSWGESEVGAVDNEPFVLHWNGSYWSIAHETFPAKRAELWAVSVAGDKAVAVGSYTSIDSIDSRGLIMREGAAPCVIPSPAPTSRSVTPLPPPVPVPGQGSRLFPETGKKMIGIFLDYWNSHGGLPQQGYPISNVIGEVSDLNQRMYTMQYTERAIFEYHPENAKPYDVLLSHLGRFQLRNRYPTGTPEQTPNDQPGSILFKETGKRLGGAFLKYWQQNGGLMQQGYPITDEFTEVSELDRKPYTVQYFERAVFEYHPENVGTQYEVLLSQLGTYRWRDKYGQNPPIPPTAGPTVSPTATPLARGIRGRAVSNNRYLYWIKDDAPNYSIYGYDWEQKRIFLVTNRPGFKFSLATDDKTLVWGEGDVEGEASIRGYNILNRTEFVAVQPQSPGTINEDTMVIDEAMLYYVGSMGGRFGIIARNIGTGQENIVIEGGRNPVIWGDTMVWSRELATCPGNQPPCLFDQELYVRKANNDRLMARASGATAFTEYDVWGDHVVWISPTHLLEGNPPNAYRISTGATNLLSNVKSSRPIINDALVTWASIGEGTVGTWSLKLHNLSNGHTMDLVSRTGAYTEAQAFIGQRAVAYTMGGERYRFAGKGDLYVVDLIGRP